MSENANFYYYLAFLVEKLRFLKKALGELRRLRSAEVRFNMSLLRWLLELTKVPSVHVFSPHFNNFDISVFEL